MLMMLLRKINKNKWIVSCLLLGLILSIALVTAIPMYSRGILNRLIQKDLEDIKTSMGKYPGYYVFHGNLAETKEQESDGFGGNNELSPAATKDWKYRPLDMEVQLGMEPSRLFGITDGIAKLATNKFIKDINLPVIAESKIFSMYKLVIKENKGGEIVNRNTYGKLNTLSGIENHVNIINGKMFSKEINNNGEYEVIVSEYAANSLNLLLNSSYIVYQPYEGYLNPDQFFKIKVVGIYNIKDTNDPYWFKWDETNARSLIMDYSLFQNEFLKKNPYIIVNQVDIGYAFNYKKVNSNNIKGILGLKEKQKKELDSYKFELLFPINDVLSNYSGKEDNIRTLLWIFEAPILFMLIIYTFMISSLIIERDKDEISVLKSRGASQKQILLIYLVESLIMSLFGTIVGPFLGMYLCKIIGASNGFLEFVQRKGLHTNIQLGDYIYSFCVILVFILTIMINVIIASRKSIVEQKQNKVKRDKSPLWKKLYLDIIILIMCGYGYYNFIINQNMAKTFKISGGSLPVDPLIYLMSTLFIMGVGLVFLRIYPYIIKLIYKIGRKKWSPVLYSSLINVARAEGKNQFIMIFLILTIAIGTFNVKAARTVNIDLENKTKYMLGADMIIKPLWRSNLDHLSGHERRRMENVIEYKEPPVNIYKEVEGIEKFTKVYNNYDAGFINSYGKVTSSYLMGIVPHEFGEIAFFDDKLLPVHWYDYLNYMTENPEAVLLSRPFEETYNMKVGDKIKIEINNALLDCYILDFIDYWPTLNVKSMSASNLIIGNLSNIQKGVGIKPYELWIKKSSNISDEKLYRNIRIKELEINNISDSNQEIIKKKNEPILQGTNGSLTMGFIATMIITAIGFLIYWIMTIKSRTLQFGILRAVGLSKRKVVSMLVWEQLLISGAAIGAGTIIGQINSKIFIPIIQLTTREEERILPFKIIAFAGDYFKLYMIIFIVLILGIIILARYIVSIKMNQAIKLGED